MYVNFIDDGDFSFSLKQSVLVTETFSQRLQIELLLIKIYFFFSLSSTEKAAVWGSARPYFVPLCHGAQ